MNNYLKKTFEVCIVDFILGLIVSELELFKIKVAYLELVIQEEQLIFVTSRQVNYTS